MDEWIGISIVALGVFIFLRIVERVFGEKEKMEEIRKMLKRAKELPKEDAEPIILEATNEMNKILLRRLVITAVLLLPLWWVYTLGEVQTPLGKMGSIWWYLISMLAINGGVWLGSALQKKIKES